MGHTMRQSVAVAALGLLLISTTRAQSTSKCPTQYSECQGIGSPFLMCCPDGAQCHGLAGNTTKLCCRPDQYGCVDIAPIKCDISAQNATLFPKSIISTSLLEGETMVPCGDSATLSFCCPFGFTCDPGNNSRCRELLDQVNWRTGGAMVDSPFSTASSASAGSTSTSLPASSSSSTSVTTSASSTTGTELPALAQTSPAGAAKFPVPAILAGFFPGIAVGFIFFLTWMCCWASYRKRHPKDEHDSRSRGIKDNISGPVSSNAARSDFNSVWSQSDQGTPRSSGVPPMGAMGSIKDKLKRSRASVRATGSHAVRGLGIHYGSGKDAEQAAPPIPALPPMLSPTPAPLGYRGVERQQGNPAMSQIVEDERASMSPQEVTMYLERPPAISGTLSPPRRDRFKDSAYLSRYSTDGFGNRASAAPPLPSLNGNQMARDTMYSEHTAFADIDGAEEYVKQWGAQQGESREEERADRPITRFPSGLTLAATAYTSPPPVSRGQGTARQLYPN